MLLSKTVSEIEQLLKNHQTSLGSHLKDGIALSQKIDALLGYQISTIEDSLSPPLEAGRSEPGAWLGLKPDVLQSTYSEFYDLLTDSRFAHHSHWVDLGAAYGRLGTLIGLLKPRLRFSGFEFIDARAQEGRRIYESLQLKNQMLFTQDICDCSFFMPQADFYFMYDFGPRAKVEGVLQKLQLVAHEKPITVVARGRGTQHWIDTSQPWLSQVKTPDRRPTYSIYFS